MPFRCDMRFEREGKKVWQKAGSNSGRSRHKDCGMCYTRGLQTPGRDPLPGRGRITTGTQERSGIFIDIDFIDMTLCYLLHVNDCSYFSVFSLYAIDME